MINTVKVFEDSLCERPVCVVFNSHIYNKPQSSATKWMRLMERLHNSGKWSFRPFLGGSVGVVAERKIEE